MVRASILLLAAASFAAPDVRASDEIVSILAYPSVMQLDDQDDTQRFIVVATRADGVTLDVTSQATAVIADATKAKIESLAVQPLEDGETTISFEALGQRTESKVVVKNAKTPRGLSFQLDVMPVFMRAGCNTGSCHGAARGKDGFRLSLFGFDPRGDHYRITREIGWRRVNLGSPADSLLLEKATGAVPHTGGKRFGVDSPYYGAILKWLEAGAPDDAGAPPKVVKLEVFPPSGVLEGPAVGDVDGKGASQPLIARATYSDGTDRDVTSLATFITNNETSAPITPEGVVTAGARGEAFLMARFETHTVGAQMLVMPKGLKYTPPEVTGNYIDKLVGEKLRKIRLTPSELCTDEEFLRRSTIDITGRLPTEDEFAEFSASQSPNKRAEWVDGLLERKEFAEIWAMKWSEWLMVKSTPQVSYKSMFLYSNWITDKIARNVPIDQMVREILSANGGTFGQPATNYYQIERDTLKTAENVAQVFMGIRTQCAQCHNHPFDRWTMDDYYGFAAFFSQIGRKQGEDYRETIVFNSGGGEVAHPVGGRVMTPQFLGGAAPKLEGKDRRVAVAEWLASPENPFFATNVANRVWAHMFGKGIVEPVDDVRVSNPAINPELLSELGKRLVEYKYDFRSLVRDICNSETYQRSSTRNASNEGDERNFAHANVRRIPAETLLDCVCQVTEAPDKFQGLPLGSRAVQIADGRTANYFLTTFGRAPRDTVCVAEAKTEPTLSQALHMLNGDSIGGKITAGSWVNRKIGEGKSQADIVRLIYIRCLCRNPSDDEVKEMLSIVGSAENQVVGLEDCFWAVLNSREFVFNH